MTHGSIAGHGQWRAIVVAAGPVLVGLGLVALGVSGLGYRSKVWSLHVGLRMFGYGGWVVVAGTLLCLIGLAVARTGRVFAGVGLIVGLLGTITYGRWMRAAKQAVPIHDITTDLDDPPAFVAILPLRANAPNPAAYGGPDVAAQQRAGYPDIAPLVVGTDPAQEFHAAHLAAQQMGWKIVSVDSAAGRIEATATTVWFGFKDDVVVRLTPATTGGTRVDVRSVSRVGGSDIGTNAARIRRYLAAVQRQG